MLRMHLGRYNNCSLIWLFFIVFSFLSISQTEARDSNNSDPNRGLLAAMKYRDMEEAVRLLKSGADANVRDENNKTPLMLAVGCDDELLVDLLLKNNAEVNVKDALGMTPLLYACLNGNVGIVKTLVAKGANVNSLHMVLRLPPDARIGVSPLMYSASRKKPEIARILIENNADLNVKDPSGKTALDMAMVSDAKIYKMLLDKGAIAGKGVDLGTGTFKDGATGLFMAACAKGDMAYVKSNFSEVKNKIGEHALYQALSFSSFHCRYEITRFLLMNGVGVNPPPGYRDLPAIFIHALKGDTFLLRLFLEKGADPNLAHANGRTALMEACFYGRHEIAEILLQNGANINAKAQNGYSALMGAGFSGNLKLIKYMVGNGADLHAKSNKKHNVIMAAASGGCHFATVEYLLKKGADAVPEALHKAISKGRPQVVELLVESDADLETTDEYGRTPLMHACRYGYRSICDYLIRKGSDVNFTAPNGSTPLIAACGNKNEKLMILLLKNGANADHANNAGETALSIAKKHRNDEMIKMLLSYGAKNK